MPRPPKSVSVEPQDQLRLEALVPGLGTRPGKSRIEPESSSCSHRGKTAQEIAEVTGYSRAAVYRWSRRYAEKDLQGLQDRPRSGRPRGLAPSKAREILDLSVHRIPKEPTHWSLRLMARTAVED